MIKILDILLLVGFNVKSHDKAVANVPAPCRSCARNRRKCVLDIPISTDEGLSRLASDFSGLYRMLMYWGLG